MDNNKKLKITTPKQFEPLVNLMVENPNMAKGYHKNTERAIIQEQWSEIKRKLNSIGPPSRETKEWMKVWSDLKTSVKNKLVHNRMENRGTGAGPFRQKVLTPLDEAVAGLLQMESVVNPEGATFGVESATVNLYEETRAEEVSSEVSMENVNLNCQSNARGRKTKRHSKAVEKETLLQQQLKVQTDLYNDVKKSLSEIERYSRKTYKLQEEQLKLKKEKLKLYKEELKKKELERSSMLKLRMAEIDLKKRKIEIEESRNSYM